MSVTAMVPDYTLTISVLSTYMPTGSSALNAGEPLVSVGRVVAVRPDRKIPRSQLALTTATGPTAFAMAAIKGREERGGHPHLMFSWRDLLAMARGADVIYLLRHDPEIQAVETWPIMSEQLRSLEDRRKALQVKVDDMLANRDTRCHTSADIDPVLIL